MNSRVLKFLFFIFWLSHILEKRKRINECRQETWKMVRENSVILHNCENDQISYKFGFKMIKIKFSMRFSRECP